MFNAPKRQNFNNPNSYFWDKLGNVPNAGFTDVDPYNQDRNNQNRRLYELEKTNLLPQRPIGNTPGDDRHNVFPINRRRDTDGPQLPRPYEIEPRPLGYGQNTSGFPPATLPPMNNYMSNSSPGWQNGGYMGNGQIPQEYGMGDYLRYMDTRNNQNNWWQYLFPKWNANMR